MKAIDELKKLEELIVNIGGDQVKRKTNHDLRDYLIGLTKDDQLLSKCDLKMLNQFVDLYSHARHEPVFGKKSFNEYMNLVQKIQKFIAKASSHSQAKLDRKVPNQTQLISKSSVGSNKESSKETCV